MITKQHTHKGRVCTKWKVSKATISDDGTVDGRIELFENAERASNAEYKEAQRSFSGQASDLANTGDLIADCETAIVAGDFTLFPPIDFSDAVIDE